MQHSAVFIAEISRFYTFAELAKYRDSRIQRNHRGSYLARWFLSSRWLPKKELKPCLITAIFRFIWSDMLRGFKTLYVVPTEPSKAADIVCFRLTSEDGCYPSVEAHENDITLIARYAGEILRHCLLEMWVTIKLFLKKIACQLHCCLLAYHLTFLFFTQC